MSSVPLPAVRPAFRRAAADLVSLSTICAEAATADVVDDDTVADLQVFYSCSECDDLAGRFMAGDYVLVSLGALAQVLSVDGPEIAPADRRCSGSEENLADTGQRIGDLPQIHIAGTGQIGSEHVVVLGLGSITGGPASSKTLRHG
ncbi:hypothetical protein J3D45_000672 [Microbacterium foliorum]|nr:hypothetical protein [Microbacterium foliorum]